MKIKPEHYAHIRSAIAAVVEAKRGAIRAHFAALETDSRVGDVDKRKRWDLFSAARLSAYACDTLYSYLDDSHIDTALRAIMQEVQL